MRGQQAYRVPRHIYFGNHGDMAVGTVFQNVLHILLRVKPAVRRAVVNTGHTPAYGFLTHRAFLCNFGMPFQLKAPPLVIGKVPVEGVHVMHDHKVDKLLHCLDREEIAAAVKKHAPVMETRLVGNGNRWQLYSGSNAVARHDGQRLPEGLNTVEHPGGGTAYDLYPCGTGFKLITFRVGNFVGQRQRYAPRPVALTFRRIFHSLDLRGEPEVVVDISRQENGVAMHRLVRLWILDFGIGGKHERSATPGFD